MFSLSQLVFVMLKMQKHRIYDAIWPMIGQGAMQKTVRKSTSILRTSKYFGMMVEPGRSLPPQPRWKLQWKLPSVQPPNSWQETWPWEGLNSLHQNVSQQPSKYMGQMLRPAESQVLVIFDTAANQTMILKSFRILLIILLDWYKNKARLAKL